MSCDGNLRRPSPLAILLIGLLLIGTIWCPSVAAQSIDYGALELLFGEPVTTSATGAPVRVSDAPVTMDIITAEDIRRSGATDIPAILRRLSGLDVMRLSPSQSEVAVRGYARPMAESRLMVLVNGRQLFTNLFSTVVWSTVPVQLEEIRQIEVVKGPNSALYGFNAAAGVINIITYNPLYDDLNSARLSLGNNDHAEASAVGTARTAKTAIRLSASALAENDPGPVAYTAADPLSQTDSRRQRVSADMMVQAAPQTQLRMETAAIREHGRYFALLTPTRADFDVLSAKVQMLSETAAGLIDATVYHNHSTALGYTASSSDTIHFNEDTSVVSVQDLFKLGANDTFRLSAEYRHSQVPTFTTKGGDLSSDIGSLGGMWDHAITSDLSILSSLRADILRLRRSGSILADIPYTNADYHRSLSGYSFNEAAAWRATPLDTLRASVSRGLQLPSLGEYGSQSPSPGQVISFGNPTLNPSSVMNYELGYDRALPQWDAKTRLAVFHQRSNHLRGFTPVVFTPNGHILQGVDEVGNSKTTGLEAGIKVILNPRWQWDGNVTWQSIQDNFTTTTAANDAAHGTPHFKANLHLGYGNDPWEVDLYTSLASASAQPVSNPTGTVVLTRISPYAIVSPRIAYRLRQDLTLELAAQTLWDFSDNPIGRSEESVLLSILARF